MKKSKLILTVGIPNAGKSTWSQQYIRANPNTVRVNADRLREMLFAYNPANIKEYWQESNLKNNESIVRFVCNKLTRSLLQNGTDVIVDNINLSKQQLKPYTDLEDPMDVNVFIKEFNTSLDRCIHRDRSRTRSVGRGYITEKYEQFQKFKTTEYYKNLIKL